MYRGSILSYVRGRGCIYNRRLRGIFYLIYRIGEWHETPLEVVCNNHFPSPIYEGYQPRQVFLVVLVVHLVLSVLVVCVSRCMCLLHT